MWFSIRLVLSSMVFNLISFKSKAPHTSAAQIRDDGSILCMRGLIPLTVSLSYSYGGSTLCMQPLIPHYKPCYPVKHLVMRIVLTSWLSLPQSS
jgi:hypothetical protein